MTDVRLFKRYLAMLGVEEAPPSLDHLKLLVHAQLTRVPFENISKLYLKRTRNAATIPSLEEHLDGIEHHNFGGTCYANNPYFCQLLRYLGYEAELCGADMSKPDVHVVSLVGIEGRECVVDVGYGSPFFEPMPRDLDTDLEIPWGENRYVLHPQDDRGRSRLDQFRNDELTHGYVAKPEPRKIGDFEDIIRESYVDTATFMNVLVVERFFAGRSVRFHNFKMSEHTPESTRVTHLEDRDELIRAVEEHCDIPAGVVREAISGISLEADIYS